MTIQLEIHGMRCGSVNGVQYLGETPMCMVDGQAIPQTDCEACSS